MTDAPLPTVRDYERRAREILPQAMWHALFGDYGAEDWQSLTNNLDGFRSIKLRPRVMVNVSRRKLSTSVLGLEISMPVMIAPAGAHQRLHVDGELASTRAAGAAGTIMALSTSATYSIEEVAAVATGPLWYQLYFMRDRKVTEALVTRAEANGYRAIVLTVDTPMAYPENRVLQERDTRYSYITQTRPESEPTLEHDRLLRNFHDMRIPGAEIPTNRSFAEQLETGLTWADLAWLRGLTPLPVIVKGVQTAEDARLCREHGVAGLVVSNHGGYALWEARSTIETLPEVVDAAGDLEVYLDGGIRRGTDILKALALGARAVFVGRPVLWGLALDGESGSAHVLEILRKELDAAMALCGVADVTRADASLVTRFDGYS